MISILKQRGGRKAVQPLLFLLVFVISAISSVYAVQELISLQGKVTTSAGALVSDGNLTVLVYDAPTGGNLVYNSSEDFNTSIQAGSFDVLLGSVTDMHLKLSDIYYMDLEINGEDIDWDGEERKQFQSGVGREVSGNFSVDLSDSTFFVDEINNRVGIGTILPGDALLNVSGTIDAWQLTINGSAVGAVSGWTDDGAIVRLTTATDSVGIGTAAPGDALLNVTGTIDAWQMTVNGSAVLTSGDYAPIGTIIPYASNLTVPNGYLWCDGSNVSRTTYADLFGVIGASYGDGDGSTTFTLPDLRGRVPVGEDLSAERLDNGTDALGQSGGEQNHILTIAEMPAHHHSYPYTPSGAGVNYRTVEANTGVTSTDTGDTGGGGAHNIMQPYQVVSYIIKYGHTGTESPGTWNFTGNNLYTSSNYNVGIGTASPAQKLSVVGSNVKTESGGVGIYYGMDAPVYRGIIYIGSSGVSGTAEDAGLIIANQAGATGNNRGGNIAFRTATGASANWNTDATLATRMVIQYDGNVGIGTTTPTQMLDVAGNVNVTGATPYVYFNGGGYMYDNGTALILGHT